MLNKPMPQSLELENGILGTIINNNDMILDCIDILGVNDFYTSSNQIIYKKIKELFTKKIEFDVVTILESLSEEEKKIVSITNTTEMSGEILRKKIFKEYVKKVKEYSNRRKIIKECTDLELKSYDTGEDLEAATGKMLNVFNGLDDVSENNSVSDSISSLDSTMTLIEQRYSNPNKLNGISTGIKNIDRAILGLAKGDLVILAGRPSMGKTVMALNIAASINAANKTLIFSLEMVKEKLFSRLLAARARVNSRDILSGNLTDNDFIRLASAGNIISKKNNIYVDDRANLTVEEIKRTAKKQKIQGGLDVVIVDHIGKIAASVKGSRNEIVGHITNELKNLAMELGVTVIALCQLNRSVETRNESVAKNKRDYKPCLSDLRDSGNIEQDADIVAFVYRDEYYSEKDMKLEEVNLKGTIEFLIAKGRDVGTGKTTLNYNENYQLITEK